MGHILEIILECINLGLFFQNANQTGPSNDTQDFRILGQDFCLWWTCCFSKNPAEDFHLGTLRKRTEFQHFWHVAFKYWNHDTKATQMLKLQRSLSLLKVSAWLHCSVTKSWARPASCRGVSSTVSRRLLWKLEDMESHSWENLLRKQQVHKTMLLLQRFARSQGKREGKWHRKFSHNGSFYYHPFPLVSLLFWWKHRSKDAFAEFQTNRDAFGKQLHFITGRCFPHEKGIMFCRLTQ